MRDKVLVSKILKRINLSSYEIGLLYHSIDDANLATVIDGFKKGYIQASNFFKTKIPEIKVTLVYSRKELDNLFDCQTPDWLVSYANSSNEIFILSPSVWEKESSHPRDEFNKTLCHEIAHLFIRQIHNSYEPVWLEEGLAYCVAGQSSRLKNSNPIFNNPEVVFLIDTRNQWNKIIYSQPDIPYALAFLLVDFLIRYYSKDRIIKLLISLKGRYSRKTFCQKFRKLYGKDIKLILKEFFSRQNIEQRGGEKYVVSRTR